MTKKTYSEKLKDPRWQKRRLEILSRDQFTCQFCGDKETTLHVHHFHYSGEPWEAHDCDLCCICEHCHSIEHIKKNLPRKERELIEGLFGYPLLSRIPNSSRTKASLIEMLAIHDRVLILKKKWLFNFLNG